MPLCPDEFIAPFGVGLVVVVKPSALVSRCPFSIFPILALSGWRWRKVGYAVGHERFTVTSMPKRGVGPYGLLRTVILNLP